MRLSGAASGPVYDLRFFCRDDPVWRLAQDLERIRGGDLRNGQNLPRTERRIRRCQRLLVDILRRHLLAVDQNDAVRLKFVPWTVRPLSLLLTPVSVISSTPKCSSIGCTAISPPVA